MTAPNTVAVLIAALHAENDAAANADEQTEAVDDVPDGHNDRQRRRSLWTLVLPDHRHIHD